jgi:hypothetical protein
MVLLRQQTCLIFRLTPYQRRAESFSDQVDRTEELSADFNAAAEVH